MVTVTDESPDTAVAIVLSEANRMNLPVRALARSRGPVCVHVPWFGGLLICLFYVAVVQFALLFMETGLNVELRNVGKLRSGEDRRHSFLSAFCRH